MNCVFCCVSESYRDVSIPTLTSLVKNTSADIFVFKVGEVDLPQIDGIHVIKLDIEDLILPNETDYDDEAMWSMGGRILAHDKLLAMGYRKMIYVDCDTLVMRNIDEMFTMGVQDGNIGAVCEYNTDLITLEKYREPKPYEFDRRSELRRGSPMYFNSGVVVFNNTPPLFERYKTNVIATPSRYVFPDQDFLNEVFPDYFMMERRFNFFAELYGYKYLSIEQMVDLKRYGYGSSIIHCHCFCKPWSPIFSFPNNKINGQFPIVPYYIEALKSESLFHSRDMIDTYKKHLEAVDTLSERIIHHEAILDSM